MASLLLVVVSTPLYSQHEEAPNALAFRWTTTNFQYPFSQKIDRFDYTNGVELSYIRHLGKLLNLAVPLKIEKANLPLDDQGNVKSQSVIGSLDALIHLKFTKPENRLYPYLLGGAGLMSEIEDGGKINPEFPVGFGINILTFPNLYLSAETQYRFDLNENRNQLQHAVGIWMVIGGKSSKKETDRDKDGISDMEDQCPDEPGTIVLMGCPDADRDGIANKLDDCPDQAGKPALGGCPDTDNDGIADKDDRCPNEAGSKALMGCPEKDQDGDGISDNNDICPDAPGSLKTQGCPDSDNDGIIDTDDKCPDLAGPAESNGCPDTDGDGVTDDEDRCPKSVGPASNKGCPELKKEEKEILAFAMKAVQFETGSAKLLESSHKILDEIAQIMKEHPEQKLRINGHTDSIGDDAENLKLSERRAKTCNDYLVAKGIQSSRISHKGFGEAKPIGNNLYAPGREQNRRVEFEMYVE